MASKYYNLEKVKPSGIELKERLVGIQRVTKVTKGGRTFSFSAIMVVGNEEGVVGHGMGKAQEVVSAITKGTEDAKKNLYRIPVVNGTIPHEQNGKFGGSRIFMRPASNGTGVIAGGAMRAVIESVGVKEGGVLSQSLNQVDISCYPTDEPENIELNIEDLELNSAKNVSDLNIDLDDVDITSDPTLNIVSVTPPAVEEEASEASVGEDEDSDVLSDSKEDAAGADKEKSSPEEDSDDKNESS